MKEITVMTMTSTAETADCWTTATTAGTGSGRSASDCTINGAPFWMLKVTIRPLTSVTVATYTTAHDGSEEMGGRDGVGGDCEENGRMAKE